MTSSDRAALERSLAKAYPYNEVFFGDLPLRERLKKRPFTVLFVALGRRLLSFLVYDLKVLPEFFRVKTFFGETVLNKMPAGFVVWWYGFLEGWELPLASCIVKHVGPGDTFFDVGANDGYFTLLAARLVGDEGHVHAFEPSPNGYGRLAPFVAGRKNITLKQEALLDRSGEVSFTYFGNAAPGSSSVLPLAEMLRARPELARAGGVTIPVKATTIDEYVEQGNIKPRFLQMDTEGTELRVLRGAARTLAAHKPMVAIELLDSTVKAGKYAETVEFMRQFGYRPHNLTRRGDITPVLDKPASATIIFT